MQKDELFNIWVVSRICCCNGYWDIIPTILDPLFVVFPWLYKLLVCTLKLSDKIGIISCDWIKLYFKIVNEKLKDTD